MLDWRQLKGGGVMFGPIWDDTDIVHIVEGNALFAFIRQIVAILIGLLLPAVQ